MIRFENVDKKFPDGTVALDNINLEVSDGEFIFLVGPSGAGKTTILKLLLKLYNDYEGKILYDTQSFDLAYGCCGARIRT